ncbi:hypothetical protein ASG11_02895 [Sphingomonas sp. Leaf357]|nr:hypothetical protein ASG11_02895 [Sphingomonas sp. Leaf357]
MEAHRWSLDRLVRPIETLIADLQSSMTLGNGDALLSGWPEMRRRRGRDRKSWWNMMPCRRSERGWWRRCRHEARAD